jgi:GNAT superfamily N-acetyltransferase
MKYFIGIDLRKGKKRRKQIETVHANMSEIGIEKQEAEIESKINHEICRGYMDMDEVIEKYVKCITLFLEDERQNIIGFLLFDINYDESYIEIHYLCSMERYKGNGKTLLDTIKDYAKISNIQKIILSPVMNEKVIMYYRKNGFSGVEKGSDGIKMVHTIQKGGKTRNRSRKSRRNNGKNRRTRKN